MKLSKYLSELKKAKRKIDALLSCSKNKNDSKLSKLCDLLESISLSFEFEISYFSTYTKEKNKEINIQYETYLDKRVSEVLDKCNYINKYVSPAKPEDVDVTYFDSILRTFGKQSELQMFEQFKYGDSNYILFGKNGSGKTTLLNALASRLFSTNALVVKATRNVNYKPDTLVSPRDINLKGAIESTNESSMVILAKLIIEKEMAQHRAHESDETIITNRVCNIYNSLGTERLFRIQPNGDLELVPPNSNSYSLSRASDGEKSIVYLIMMTLLAPKNSFIFIDEPENHLNSSLMNKLFDRLEAERKDVVFIYATHNVSFIETRNNAKLIYLRKTEKGDSWLFTKYEDVKNLPVDVVLNVEGLRDDVVFCEGEHNNSFDKKILSILLPNYQVIPSQGCSKVILQTSIFNENATILRKKAFGIVDYDFRSDDDVADLKKKSVFVLDVNEIENLFICTECLKEMSAFLSTDKKIDDLEKNVIQVSTKKIDDIKKDYATKLFRKLHLKNRFDSIEKIEEKIDELNKHNKNLFLEHYEMFCSRLADALDNNDYREVLRLVPGKMILNDVARMFGLVSGEEFARQLLNRISSNEQLINDLSKYLPTFPFSSEK